MKYRYIKYSLPLSDIYNIINKKNIERIFFFLDLQGISKGFYNETNIDYEVNKFIENDRQLSMSLIDELKYFCNNLWSKFNNLSPYFVIFYDDGYNLQNTMLNSTYKDGRSTLKDLCPDLERRELFKKLKQYWFKIIDEQFNKDNISKVYYLKEYESDLIPYYFIKNNKLNTLSDKYLKIILSPDKDLLQCCQLPQTYQVINNWKNDKTTQKKSLNIQLYDNNNALKYIDNTFLPGKLTSDYISLILSMAGDKADNIGGISGIGIKKAIKLIENNNISSNINEFKKNKNFLPAIIQENFDLILNNYKLINFDEQIDRTKNLN